MQLTIRLTLGT